MIDAESLWQISIDLLPSKPDIVVSVLLNTSLYIAVSNKTWNEGEQSKRTSTTVMSVDASDVSIFASDFCDAPTDTTLIVDNRQPLPAAKQRKTDTLTCYWHRLFTFYKRAWSVFLAISVSFWSMKMGRHCCWWTLMATITTIGDLSLVKSAMLIGKTRSLFSLSGHSSHFVQAAGSEVSDGSTAWHQHRFIGFLTSDASTDITNVSCF